nr:DNA-binding protein HEXBP-like [Coffea arabica]
MTCGFCGAANHMEDNCWKKGQVRKCYRCDSAEHLIAQCPHLPKEGNLPRAEGNTSKPINVTGMEVGGPSDIGGPNNTGGSSGAGVRATGVGGPVNRWCADESLDIRRGSGNPIGYILPSAK